MQLFDTNALIDCIREAVRIEINELIRNQEQNIPQPVKEDKLLTKKEMAEELDISLVTLTDWMKKGLPFKRLYRRVYFQKKEVIDFMENFRKAH